MKALAKSRPMSRKLCLECKGGRLLCGRSFCPLLQRINIQAPIEAKLNEVIFGPSPSVFVGWKNYPNVFVGPLTSISEEDAAIMDDPSRWYGIGFEEIIRMRSMLVRSKTRCDVSEKGRFIEKNQEVALSVKPVDLEVKFERKPRYSISFSPISQPMGPSGILKNFEITENPDIPRKVDSLVSDDLKAKDGAFQLYKAGFDVYYITNILASGILGSKRKKLVPTRWSITATDDMLGRELIEEIKRYPPVNEYQVYTNSYLENHFEILVMPTCWEFEQFEAWAPDTLWTMAYTTYALNVEHERYRGRSDYAIKEGGGYYASRLAVLEALSEMRRQAGIIIFREIHEGYMPVGVWEVRENVRMAFKKRKKFSTMDEALEDIGERLMIPMEEYIKRSTILRQKRLDV